MIRNFDLIGMHEYQLSFGRAKIKFWSPHNIQVGVSVHFDEATGPLNPGLGRLVLPLLTPPLVRSPFDILDRSSILLYLPM